MTKTRAQIQTEINQKKKEKQNCIITKSNYQNSLTETKKLLSNLNNTTKDIGLCKDYFKKYYTVNGNTADNGKLDNMKNTVDGYIKKINNNIIPSINSNISTLNTKITRIEKEIIQLENQYMKAQV